MSSKITISSILMLLIFGCSTSSYMVDSNSSKSFNFKEFYPDSLILYHDDSKSIYSKNKMLTHSDVWSNSNKNIFVTQKGKIIETHGFKYNIEIPNLNLSDSFVKVLKNKQQQLEYSVRLSDPDSGYLRGISTFTFIDEVLATTDIRDLPFKLFLIEERFDIKSIRWSGINYYWVDKDLDVWESRQSIHPYEKDVTYIKYPKDL